MMGGFKIGCGVNPYHSYDELVERVRMDSEDLEAFYEWFGCIWGDPVTRHPCHPVSIFGSLEDSLSLVVAPQISRLVRKPLVSIVGDQDSTNRLNFEPFANKLQVKLQMTVPLYTMNRTCHRIQNKPFITHPHRGEIYMTTRFQSRVLAIL